MTKKELLQNTKAELIKHAKLRLKLDLKAQITKPEMVTLILAASAKKARAAAKKIKSAVSSLKKSFVKKKATAQPKAKAKPKLKLVKTEAKAKPASKKKATVTKIKPKPLAAAPRSKRPASIGKIGKAKKKIATTKKPTLKVTAPKSLSMNGESRVQEAKFYVAPSQEHLETGELPERYYDNRILLLVRDPNWIFSFWDIAPEREQQVAHKNGLNIGSCKKIVRVYDVTEVEFDGFNAHKHIDLEVGSNGGDWYINVQEAGRSYCAEIGLMDAEGNFYAVARSNAVTTPRSTVSERVDEEWVVTDEDFWNMYALSGGFASSGASSEELTGAMRERLEGETSSGAVSSFGASEMMVKPEDDFWFRLDCDLTVYGAVKPGGKVTLQGRQIEVRPDGTFTARYSLPDGIQVIDAVAESGNKVFWKTITPTVSRSTAAFESKRKEGRE